MHKQRWETYFCLAQIAKKDTFFIDFKKPTQTNIHSTTPGFHTRYNVKIRCNQTMDDSAIEMNKSFDFYVLFCTLLYYFAACKINTFMHTRKLC